MREHEYMECLKRTAGEKMKLETEMKRSGERTGNPETEIRRSRERAGNLEIEARRFKERIRNLEAEVRRFKEREKNLETDLKNSRNREQKLETDLKNSRNREKNLETDLNACKGQLQFLESLQKKAAEVKELRFSIRKSMKELSDVNKAEELYEDKQQEWNDYLQEVEPYRKLFFTLMPHICVLAGCTEESRYPSCSVSMKNAVLHIKKILSHYEIDWQQESLVLKNISAGISDKKTGSQNASESTSLSGVTLKYMAFLEYFLDMLVKPSDFNSKKSEMKFKEAYNLWEEQLKEVMSRLTDKPALTAYVSELQKLELQLQETMENRQCKDALLYMYPVLQEIMFRDDDLSLNDYNYIKIGQKCRALFENGWASPEGGMFYWLDYSPVLPEKTRISFKTTESLDYPGLYYIPKEKLDQPRATDRDYQELVAGSRCVSTYDRKCPVEED